LRNGSSASVAKQRLKKNCRFGTIFVFNNFLADEVTTGRHRSFIRQFDARDSFTRNRTRNRIFYTRRNLNSTGDRRDNLNFSDFEIEPLSNLRKYIYYARRPFPLRILGHVSKKWTRPNFGRILGGFRWQYNSRVVHLYSANI